MLKAVVLVGVTLVFFPLIFFLNSILELISNLLHHLVRFGIRNLLFAKVATGICSYSNCT